MSVVFDAVTTTGVIDALAEEAIYRARHRQDAALVTYREPLAFVPDALGFLSASARSLGDGVLWSQPDTGTTLAGAGVALEITANGADRFAHVTSAIESLSESIVGNRTEETFPILGGFAFDDRAVGSSLWHDYAGARLVVPRLLVHYANGEVDLRVTCPVSATDSVERVARRLRDLLLRGRIWATATVDGILPESGPIARHSLPSRTAWEASVAMAIAMIRRGAIDKVVLAREERIHASRPFDPIAALGHLRAFDPAAILFAMQSGRSWFIGATPERLVRLDHGRVDVTCLAGSIAIGQSPAERRELAEQLLGSAKDREEHEIVVRSTQAVLAEVCQHVYRVHGTPRVVPARSVQHLETPLVGYLHGPDNIIDLVERLHPTPAVGGYPRDRAAETIRELEAIERGWYAGPFGWVDLDGSGEFAVAIRSALVSGATASLFAGCGIVVNSCPADEFHETQLKMKPMLAALGLT